MVVMAAVVAMLVVVVVLCFLLFFAVCYFVCLSKLTMRALPKSTQMASMDAETTKYLGGDVEHTHLVKGLDYALLVKIREEERQKQLEVRVVGLIFRGPRARVKPGNCLARSQGARWFLRQERMWLGRVGLVWIFLWCKILLRAPHFAKHCCCEVWYAVMSTSYVGLCSTSGVFEGPCPSAMGKRFQGKQPLNALPSTLRLVSCFHVFLVCVTSSDINIIACFIALFVSTRGRRWRGAAVTTATETAAPLGRRCAPEL